MGTIESQIKIIKAIVEHPEEPISKIAELADVAQGTAYSNVEELYSDYMNKALADEEDIPATMAFAYNGQISAEEMQIVIDYMKKRKKSFNNKQETSNNNIIGSMDSNNSNNNNSPESQNISNNNNMVDIDTDIKALQLVLEKYRNKTVSNDRVNKVIDIYRAMEFKYKKNPYALRQLLVQILGAGPGELAFQDFLELIKYYLPPAELAKFGLLAGNGAQASVSTGNNGGFDPAMMSMFSGGTDGNGEINPMALMMGGGGNNGGNNQNWLQNLLIADYFEERRRKRAREDEDKADKIRREREEADNRRLMNMMMMGMMNKGDNNNSSIPPGYTVRRTYDAAGKPQDEYIPISQTALNNGGAGQSNNSNPADVVKAIAEVIPKIMPQQNTQQNEFMQAMALKAIDKLNVQTDPLESAARVYEVLDKIRPAQAVNPDDPYKKIEAEIAVLDQKMKFAEKQWDREDRILDKRMAQENTKGYIDTIERVLSNVGAPLVEKFATGFAGQRTGAAVPPMSMPGQPPAVNTAAPTAVPEGVNEEEYFMSLPPEQLQAILAQRDQRLAEFNVRNAALEKAARAKGLASIDNQSQEGAGSNNGYYVNMGGSGGGGAGDSS